MGILFEKQEIKQRIERSHYHASYETVEIRRLSRSGQILFALASIPLIGALVSDSYVDLFGDRNTAAEISEERQRDAALSEAEARYGVVFEAASPAGKFALQYLAVTDVVSSVRVVEPNNGNGVLGLATGAMLNKSKFRTSFGDGCLDKTAYDINGGDITGIITGFSSGSITGEVPTAAANAYVDGENPDVLVIQSGHTSSRDLRFDGLMKGASLQPADEQTKDVLATYGCEPEFRETRETYDSDDSSPWVTG